MLFACCAYNINIYAQQVDSLQINKLREVEVTESAIKKNLRSGMPIQSLDNNVLETGNVLQLSDAVKHFAGVMVKDFGGVGGLKTVSVRGMAAPHTAVGYDGMLVSDMQSGTVDVGRFSLDNVRSITLSNGHNEDIFQPARLFASASVLNIHHGSPEFDENKNISGKISLKSGSFGLINPSLTFNTKFNSVFSASLSGEYLQTDGDYPFTLIRGWAVTSVERRYNTDVQSFRIEPGIYADFRNYGKMYLKAYYYQLERGLPGAVRYDIESSHQRLWDDILFVQTQYKTDYSRKLSFLLNGKYAWSYQHYLDPDDHNPLFAKEGDTYYQQEYYLSMSALYKIGSGLSFSLSTDGFINQLNPDKTRYSWLTSLSGKYVTERLTITGNLLNTIVYDTIKADISGKYYRKVTPTLSFSFKPISDEDFRIRTFYKEIFRMPTFNDLYYTETRTGGIISEIRDVKPEFTTQYNVGLTWTKSFDGLLKDLNISGDGYYNKVKDKIVAIPTRNLFYWTIVNKGWVDIKGLDIVLKTNLLIRKDIEMNLSGNYTYQKVIDKTNPQSDAYNNELPYSPNHIGAGTIGIKMPWITLGYNILFSGKRYTIELKPLQGYVDQNISIRKNVKTKYTDIALTAEALNIGNVQYSVINGYPMQGRSFRLTVSLPQPLQRRGAVGLLGCIDNVN